MNNKLKEGGIYDWSKDEAPRYIPTEKEAKDNIVNLTGYKFSRNKPYDWEREEKLENKAKNQIEFNKSQLRHPASGSKNDPSPMFDNQTELIKPYNDTNIIDFIQRKKAQEFRKELSIKRKIIRQIGKLAMISKFK